MKEREVIVRERRFDDGILDERKDVGELIRCKDCIHNVANRETDPMDITDYSGKDIVCDYFMTDGQEPDDYCSKAEPKEKQ